MVQIHVCETGDRGERKYFLRLHLSPETCPMIRFETRSEFTKPEADYRAMMLSAKYGYRCDELPTHPEVESYPQAD